MRKNFSETESPHNKHNVYAGEFVIAPRAPQTSAPSSLSPAMQAVAEGSQKVHENLAGFESRAIELADYALDQQNQAFIDQTVATAKADATRRNSLPDGHADSFYDAQGRFRQDYYNNWLAQATAPLDSIHTGYTLPTTRDKAAADAAAIKRKLTIGIDAQMAANLAPRARKAAEKLAAYQAEQGDFVASRATIMGIPSDTISDLDRQILLADTDRRSIVYNCEAAISSGNPEAYLAIAGNAELMAKLTPEQRRRVLALQNQLAIETQFDDSLVPLDPKGDSPGSPAKSTKQPTHLGLPMGANDELVHIYDKYKVYENDQAKRNPIMQQEAYAALDRYAASFVTADLSDEDIFHFTSLAKQFGLEASAKAIIEKYAAALKPSQAFDLTNQVKALKLTHFNSYEIQAMLKAERATLASQLAADPLDTEGKASETEKHIKVHEARAKALSEELSTRIIQKYSDWFEAQSNRDKITDAAKTARLMNIVDEEKKAIFDEYQLNFTQADNFSNSSTYREAIQQEARLREANASAIARRAALDKETAAQDARLITAQQELESQQHLQTSKAATPNRQFKYASSSVSSLGSEKLPDTLQSCYLAVPKGDQLAGMTVAFKHKGRTHYLPCKEADVSTPTFSTRALGSLGMLGTTNSHTITYSPTGEAILTQNAIATGDTNMYRALMAEEARRDSSGNLMVYSLPKGDGGGSYEVAGINEKSHPAKAAQLKALIESGASNDDVEREVMLHYKEITQAGRDLIAPATNSKGIELFMRDCTLNHGPKGAATILRRAIGIGDSDPLTPALQSYVQNYGEQALLNVLSIARRNHYLGILKAKPEKEIFRKGWLENRLPDITRASFSLLRQRSQD